MKRSQADRAVVAARAAAAGRTGRHRASASTDVARREQTPVKQYGWTGTRRHGNKVNTSKAQRNSEGRPSEWAASPYFWTDAKWGASVSDHNGTRRAVR